MVVKACFQWVVNLLYSATLESHKQESEDPLASMIGLWYEIFNLSQIREKLQNFVEYEHTFWADGRIIQDLLLKVSATARVFMLNGSSLDQGRSAPQDHHLHILPHLSHNQG